MEIDKIYQGDCMDLLKVIPDSQVDLVIADPPYFQVMVTDHLGNKYEWDKQWDSFEDYLKWCKLWLTEVKRILKPNGSIYIFQDDKNCAYVQIIMDKLGLNLENNITWVKPNNMTIKGWDKFRCYAPITERILFYSKERGYIENQMKIKPMKKIRDYLNKERKKAKLSLDKMCLLCGLNDEGHGGIAYHWCSSKNPVMITREHYKTLKQKTGFFRIPYDKLLKEYKLVQEGYIKNRRTFNPKRNYTDVWTYNITSSQENTVHPTQKPIVLIRRIIDTSSKENDLVVDLFVGSGTVPLACQQLKRRWVGSEKESEYISLINKRLKQKNIHHFEKDVGGYEKNIVSKNNNFASQPFAEGDIIIAKFNKIPKRNFTLDEPPSVSLRAFPDGKGT